MKDKNKIKDLDDVHSWQEKEDQEKEDQFNDYFERQNTEDPTGTFDNINYI